MESVSVSEYDSASGNEPYQRGKHTGRDVIVSQGSAVVILDLSVPVEKLTDVMDHPKMPATVIYRTDKNTKTVAGLSTNSFYQYPRFVKNQYLWKFICATNFDIIAIEMSI